MVTQAALNMISTVPGVKSEGAGWLTVLGRSICDCRFLTSSSSASSRDRICKRSTFSILAYGKCKEQDHKHKHITGNAWLPYHGVCTCCERVHRKIALVLHQQAGNASAPVLVPAALVHVVALPLPILPPTLLLSEGAILAWVPQIDFK